MIENKELLYIIEGYIRDNLAPEDEVIKLSKASIRDLGYWSGLSKALAIVRSLHTTLNTGELDND